MKSQDKSLLINIISLLAYRGTSFLFPLLTLPYLARTLGVSGMGVLAVATTCVFYCSIIADWGFNLRITKDIAHHRDDKARVSQLFWSTFNAKLLLITVTMTILLTVTWLNVRWHYLFWIILANATTLIGSLFSFGWLMQGYEKLSRMAIITTLGNGCAIPLTFLLVESADDIWLAALIPGLTSIISAIITLKFVVEMRVTGRYRFEVAEIRCRLKESADLFITIAGSNLFNSINVLIIAAFSSHYATGIYNGAERLRKAANSIPEQINNAFFPRVSYLLARDRAAAIQATRRSLLLSFSLSLVIVVFTYFFADTIVSVVLGSAFLPGAAVLRVLVLCFLFGNVAYPAGLQILIPHGLARQRMFIMLGVGLLNLPVCCLLVWRYGVTGAAWSMVIAEMLVCLGIFIVMAKEGILRQYLIKDRLQQLPVNE